MNTVLTVEMDCCSLCSVSQGMQLTLQPITSMQFVQPASQSLTCHLGGQIHFCIYVPPQFTQVTLMQKFNTMSQYLHRLLPFIASWRKYRCISQQEESYSIYVECKYSTLRQRDQIHTVLIITYSTSLLTAVVATSLLQVCTHRKIQHS